MRAQIATIKHFAENNQENNRANVNVNVDEQALREMELPRLPGGGRRGRRRGHVLLQLPSTAQHSCSNNQLLKLILKTEWGFKGWVMSDWGAAQGATECLLGLHQEMYNIGVHPRRPPDVGAQEQRFRPGRSPRPRSTAQSRASSAR